MGTDSLETRNVFIDTVIFISQNYNYRNVAFNNITQLSKSGKANIFVTDITIKEIEAHIKDDIAKASQATLKFRKDAKILKNINESPFVEYFNEIDQETAAKHLKQQLSDFILESKSEVLLTNDVSIDSVFEKYFSKQPPFGERKKKSEFPDAFVIEKLENWCENTKQKMYVISTDPDFKFHCELSDNLLSLDKLSEFINLVEFHDEVLAPAIQMLVDKNIDSIEQAISDTFLYQGFWIDDQDGEVNEVRINEQMIDDMLILKIDQNSAVIEYDVITNISADLVYDDLDTAVYDSEEKVLIPLHTIEKTVEQNISYTATIYIAHDVDKPELFKIDRIDINSSRSYDFPISSDDEWPYK